ncbi:hypothetical protein CALVIDRAFT_365805 [Calocera viscosa TUFC12733]|uniref:Uncharacterized protein n=1 Tax=Calocera viscosa (strain TUFC12733) TaxID=1330018 RepID=A0A167H3Q1_CALVF|nr:hypothetical protein CALVIDRAFT_365805 [Calocera viscosa TUFC12733]
MLSLLFVLVLSTIAPSALAQVTCTPFTTYGITSCPYAAPTTDQLNALIDRYCGGTYCEANGGLPCYYDQDITEPTTDGQSYYMVATNTVYSGDEGQATCYSSLQEIVTSCTEQYGEYGWYDGFLTAGQYPFEVITCALA